MKERAKTTAARDFLKAICLVVPVLGLKTNRMLLSNGMQLLLYLFCEVFGRSATSLDK